MHNRRHISHDAFKRKNFYMSRSEQQGVHISRDVFTRKNFYMSRSEQQGVHISRDAFKRKNFYMSRSEQQGVHISRDAFKRKNFYMSRSEQQGVHISRDVFKRKNFYPVVNFLFLREDGNTRQSLIQKHMTMTTFGTFILGVTFFQFRNYVYSRGQFFEFLRRMTSLHDAASISFKTRDRIDTC